MSYNQENTRILYFSRSDDHATLVDKETEVTLAVCPVEVDASLGAFIVKAPSQLRRDLLTPTEARDLIVHHLDERQRAIWEG